MSKKTSKKVTKVQEEELDLDDEDLDLDLDLDLDDEDEEEVDADLEMDEEEVDEDEDDSDDEDSDEDEDEDLDLDDEDEDEDEDSDDEDEDEDEDSDDEEEDEDDEDEDLDLDDEDEDEDEEEEAPKAKGKGKAASKASKTTSAKSKTSGAKTKTTTTKSKSTSTKTEKPAKKLAVQKGVNADLEELYGEVQAVLDLREEQVESGEGIPRSVTISNELLHQIIAGELSEDEGQFKAAMKRILTRMGLGSEAIDLLEGFNFTKNDVADIYPSVIEGVRKVLFMGAGVKVYATPEGSLTLKGNVKEERIVEPKFDHVKLHTKIGEYVAVTASSPAPTAVKTQGNMVKGKFVAVKVDKKASTKADAKKPAAKGGKASTGKTGNKKPAAGKGGKKK